MPLFKGITSKATPKKVIDYITNPKKAVIISSLSMDDSRDYAKQFKETCDMYGKGKGFNVRKYYHFKLSPDQADYPSPQQAHELAEKMAQRLFSAHECIIATHLDTDTTHSHIIVNSVGFETGKKLHVWWSKYAEYKDLADSIGKEFGFTPLDWRNKTKEKRERLSADEAITSDNRHLSQEECHIAKRDTQGVASWKDALRQTIDEAKANCTDRSEFQKYLQDNYSVTMPRNTTKTVSFVHPAVGENYAVRGTKLGKDYTAESINKALQENKKRSVLNDRLFIDEEQQFATNPSSTVYADTNIETFISQSTIQARNRNRLAPRSVGDVSTELRSIDTAVKSIIGRNQSNGGIVDRLDEKRTEEQPSTAKATREHERSIQQKPKRRSRSYER